VAPRPARQPLESTSFTTRKTLEGLPGAGQSKPTQPDTLSVRTEHPDDAQGFLAPRHRHGPQHRYKTLLDSDACRP
jgi:hypothetical protein